MPYPFAFLRAGFSGSSGAPTLAAGSLRVTSRSGRYFGPAGPPGRVYSAGGPAGRGACRTGETGIQPPALATQEEPGGPHGDGGPVSPTNIRGSSMGYQIKARGLNDNEVIMANRVFTNQFTDFFLRNKVMLANGLGAQDRPFTSIDIGTSTYRIYIGPGAWDPSTLLTLKYKSSFIHEMTHVWQMHNQSWFGAVWASSLLAQLCRQGNAYLYG